MKKFVTVKDIASKLRMSHSTVSKALLDYPSISAMTKERVQKMAKELNYSPNQSAIKFKSGHSSLIAIIIPSFTDHFYTAILSGVEDTAMKHNRMLLVFQSKENFEREKEIISYLSHLRIEGLLIAISKATSNYQHLNELEEDGIPIVHIARNPVNKPCHFVSTNVYKGSILAVDYLVSKGHKNIIHLAGPKHLSTSNERVQGFIDGMYKNKLSVNAKSIVNLNLTTTDTINAIKKLAAEKDKPTGIICFKDTVAFDAIDYLKHHSKTLLNKLSFISFGHLPFTKYFSPYLAASIDNRAEDIGISATEALLNLISQNNIEAPLTQNVLDCKLVVY